MEGAIQVAIFRSHYLAYFVKNEGFSKIGYPSLIYHSI